MTDKPSFCQPSIYKMADHEIGVHEEEEEDNVVNLAELYQLVGPDDDAMMQEQSQLTHHSID